ncbi:hypothetical protein VHP8226_02833 [Vibrio hippocampi]|uniref:Transposase n=1 Tax=Vibrio hippocampi TaxID=654686 RepID=A0ABM8ZKN6_9VIBR|nr:hypothetical protein VHP8226_02833 [Vibrio hippocampi]
MIERGLNVWIKKIKMENLALKQELHNLYQTHQLENQLKESKQRISSNQEKFQCRDDIFSSSLKGSYMLQTVRNIMVVMP